MRQPLPPRRAQRLRLAVAASIASAGLGSAVGCGPDQSVVWLCLNPVTGKEDWMTYDTNHYANGMADPCHCYDPCGPSKSCPIVVDAGPPAPGCAGGDNGGDGGH